MRGLLTRDSSNWSPSYESCCQALHFFAGLAIVLAFVQFKQELILGFLSVVCYGLFKEFIFDAISEGDNFWDNLLDFTFYFAGAVFALALVKVATLVPG